MPQENHSRARLHGALILRTPAWRSLYSPSATARHYFATTLFLNIILSRQGFSSLITQTSANANTIVQAPLMFVRGGYVRPGNDLYAAGNLGYNWSSVSGGSYSAYYLLFSSGGVYPSVSNARYYGLSVRCVALGG